MRIAILIVINLIFSGSVFSQDLSAAIRDYNAAQQSGDRSAKVDAARGLGAAALASPVESDTPILVFEAAQTLTLNGLDSETADLISWLAAESFPDGSAIAQIDVDLLVSYARWRDDPKRSTRNALDEAMIAVAGYEPTLLTLFVFQQRYVSDLESGAFQRLPKSALAAAEHLEPVKHVIGESWSAAAIVAHSAAFNRSTREDALYAMAEHYVALQKLHAEMHKEGADHPEWINKQIHLSDTWQLAMAAYFDSLATDNRGKKLRRDERLEAILNGAPEDVLTDARHDPVDPASPERLPLCPGRFDMQPKMEYPSRAARQGRVGAVMLSFEIQDGRPTNAEVLAAIPFEGFADDSIETLNKWTWIVDEGVDQETCGLDHDNIRMPFTFVLE